jgi:hypothetical protein
MSKKLDVDKVDAALKRAARAAVSGSREERSGRFVVREADSGRFITSSASKDSRRKVDPKQ